MNGPTFISKLKCVNLNRPFERCILAKCGQFYWRGHKGLATQFHSGNSHNLLFGLCSVPLCTATSSSLCHYRKSISKPFIVRSRLNRIFSTLLDQKRLCNDLCGVEHDFTFKCYWIGLKRLARNYGDLLRNSVSNAVCLFQQLIAVMLNAHQ